MSMLSNIKHLTRANALTFYVYALNEEMVKTFRTLMEDKGLYQAVSIDRAAVLKSVLERVSASETHDVEVIIDTSMPAWVNLTLSETVPHTANRGGTNEPVPTIQPTNIKLFCAKCKRDEAFKPIWFQDITNAMNSTLTSAIKVVTPKGLQFFSLVYQCQSCQGQPEVFLIRREQLKLAVHGRSPIQSVSIPQFIPDPESKWYREATIAKNVGRTLAGIFYLRTFIEQFARRITEIKDRRSGDEILSDYNTTLPDPPRGTMPSLKEWYEKLSEAIHSANEDEQMLTKAFEEVDRHFDFRRLYKIPYVRPKKTVNEDDSKSKADSEINTVKETIVPSSGLIAE